MNEIEKMYKNAGVEKIKLFSVRTGINPNAVIYPPFTAEKQVELIKLLGSMRDYTIEIQKFKGDYYVGCRSAESNDKFWGSSNVFENAIAELVNEIWLSLTKKEKQQMKDLICTKKI